MKKLLSVVALVGLLASAGLSAAEKVQIGYVDLRHVVVESKSGQKHKADMDKAVKAKQSQLDKEQQKLKAFQESFEKEQLTLSDTQKKAKQQEFQQQLQEAQKLANAAQKELAEKDSGYTQKSIAEVRALVVEVAKQEGMSLVLEKTENSILYAADGMDLTQKVLEKYNAKNR